MKAIFICFFTSTGLAAIASGSSILQVGWIIIFITALGMLKGKR